MTEAMMQALVLILLGSADVTLTVSDRAVWDSEETDLELPCLTMRTLATTLPARDLGSRGGVRRAMVELAADSDTLTGSVRLLEACLAALSVYESGPASVVVSAGTAQIASIHLDDVTQSPPVRERSYRQTAILIVAFYE